MSTMPIIDVPLGNETAFHLSEVSPLWRSLETHCPQKQLSFMSRLVGAEKLAGTSWLQGISRSQVADVSEIQPSSVTGTCHRPHYCHFEQYRGEVCHRVSASSCCSRLDFLHL